MKKLILLPLLLLSTHSFADAFVSDARSLAGDLKKSLVKNLSASIKKDGVAKSIPFCHINVKPIAKGAAGDRLKKYQFGRTSHKLRNTENIPQPWMQQYLDNFKGKMKNEVKDKYVVHRLKNGKRVYLEPLYVQAKCLMCHGQRVSQPVQEKLNSLYPEDKATGFKLNEFRGFIWVKEK